QVTPPVGITAGQLLSNVTVGQFSDLVVPNAPQSTYTASINWGNGNITSNATLAPAPGGGFLVSGSNTYTAPGNYTISIDVQSQTENSGQTNAVVNAADASLTSSPPFTISSTEGQTFNGQVTTFQYGNLAVGAGYFTAKINWNTNTNTNITTGRILADPQ